MSKFLFTVWPLTGHIHPNLAIATELRKVGHQVAFYTGSHARGMVEGAGFQCFPLRKVDENLIEEMFLSPRGIQSASANPFQLRDRWRVITILSTALLILSLLLVFALTSRHSAVLARAAAEKSAAGESDARQLAESRQREAEKATIAANLAQANERTQRDIAVQQRDLAIARQLAVRSQSLLADRSQDDESAALLAIASIRIKPTFENDFALRQATSLLPVQVFAVSTGPSVFSIALSPGAHYLATGSSNGNVVRVFSLRRGKEIDELDIDGPCRALAFSPDDEYLAASGKDNIYIKLPRIKEKPQRIHYSSPFLSFTKDRRYLIAGSALFELPTGREVIRFSAAEKTSHAQISRDGETLFIQKSDGRITISDISSGKEIQKIEHLLGAEVKANFVNNGQYVAALNDWETAGVYDVSSGKEITRVKEDSPIQLMALTPGGRPSLFLTVSSGNMRMVQNPGGSELWRLHSDVVEAYFTPDGKRLVTQGLSAARVFEAFDGKEVAHVTCHGGSMYASAVDESGKYLATACNKVGDDPGERVIRVFEMAPASGSNGPELTKRSRRQTHLDSAGIRLGEHYRQEGAGPPSFDEVVRVVDATKGRLVSRVHHSEGTSVATFSPDSRYVALGGVFGAVGVYVIQTGKLQCRYSQEHNDIGVIVFSGNSRRFAVESRGTVTILEVANCEVISKIQPPHGRDAHDPKLNFDGSVLTTFGRETMGPFVVSAAQDLTDRYSLDPVEMIRDACARVTRNLTRAEWTEYVGGSAPFQKVCPNLQSRSSEGNVR